jgi:hypothetical protein
LADDLAVLLVEIHKCGLVFKHVPKSLMDIRLKMMYDNEKGSFKAELTHNNLPAIS